MKRPIILRNRLKTSYHSVLDSHLVPNNPIRKKRGRPSLKSQVEVIKEPTKRGRKSKVSQQKQQELEDEVQLKEVVLRSGRKSKVVQQEQQRRWQSEYEQLVQEEQDVAQHEHQQEHVLQQEQHQEVALYKKVQRSGRKGKAQQENEQQRQEVGKPKQQQQQKEQLLHFEVQRSGQKVAEQQKVKRSSRPSQVCPHQDPVKSVTLTGNNGIDQIETSSGRKRRSTSLISGTTKSKKAKTFQSEQQGKNITE